MIYNPANWYWIVAGDATHSYSSAADEYVAADDPGYAAWLATGSHPTAIPTESGLFDVLTSAGVRPSSIGTVSQRAAVMLTGSTVTLISSAASSLNGSYPVDPTVVSYLNSVQNGINAGVGLPGGGTTLPYPDASGQDHQFTAAQYTEFAAAVANYVFALIRCAQGKSSALPSNTLTIS